MGDFFYYGQKDTIQRLNELAGRGAVVASYAPKVGMSPVGGPNGYMDPAWLDADKAIRSNIPIGSGEVGKFGYSYMSGGGAQRLIKIASLRASASSTYSSVRIDAVLGNWVGSQLTAMTIVIGSREGISVDWTASRIVPNNARFIAYLEADGQISVYLFFPPAAFAQASFQIYGIQATTYAAPPESTTATGTLVWDSTASPGTVGYISPRVRGTAGSPGGDSANGTSFDQYIEIRSRDGNIGSTSFISGGVVADSLPAGTSHELIRLGLSGMTGTSHPGFWSFMSSEGNGGVPFKTGYKLTIRARDSGSGTFSPDLLSVAGNGTVIVPGLLEVGVVNTEAQGVSKLSVPNCLLAKVVSGNFGNTAGAALNVATHTVTGSSIRTGGTVNTSGNDYAEYIAKKVGCNTVMAGQIIGISGDNKVSDKWDDAVMFAIKSTAPSFVGGDSWADDLGLHPEPSAGEKPAMPVRAEHELDEFPETNTPEMGTAFVDPGDTDEEWEVKLAAYSKSLEDWENASHEDSMLMAEFDAKLEAARQRVDRIAIAGRVPVNVLGAHPGDYIVPVQDGVGIKGIAVREDDLSMKQYLHAVGRVISIEPDGRAYVMVKAV
ncbi:hypothetical protein [Janthinobacterium lividum]|uniref:hypothetical protein n=1 Tax=Janthinobacterium lividum TaxID=29581 RepID=UPI00140B625D|nr:hypothetical protein [Janthinobacterium lividum]NHQ89961.1 hypothetical protein [Janthinobacterium lividum]